MPIPRYALIIGAMKSGTTTVFHYLAQHPAIAGAHPKEPGFFAFDYLFVRGRAWYDGLFGFDPARHRWALDGSTDYTKAPFCGDVRARMAAMEGAEFRLIYIMRHPLRRIESHAQDTQRKRLELGQVRSDIANHSLDHGISPISMAATRYAEQIDHYKDMFDSGRLMLLTLEEFSRDPEAHVAEICRFLGLDPLPALAPPAKDNRAATRRRRAGWWNALRRVPLLPAIATAAVPKDLRRWLEAKTSQKVVIPGRFRLTPDEEQAVIAELRPDLIRLRDVYGIDVEGVWGIDLEARAGGGIVRPALASQ